MASLPSVLSAPCSLSPHVQIVLAYRAAKLKQNQQQETSVPAASTSRRSTPEGDGGAEVEKADVPEDERENEAGEDSEEREGKRKVARRGRERVAGQGAGRTAADSDKDEDGETNTEAANDASGEEPDSRLLEAMKEEQVLRIPTCAALGCHSPLALK